MASGFTSCHPDQVERLKRLAIKSGAVTQGVGYATGSAGTHAPVGKSGGKDFGHCIDLSCIAVPFTRSAFDNLVEKGFAPFPREVWPSGGAHWHLVDLTRPEADGGKCPDHLDVVNRQLAEWVRGGDGLIGDEPMPTKWKPTVAQREFARGVWISGVLPSATIPVKVIEHSTGVVRETLNMVPGGDHIADQGKLYVE